MNIITCPQWVARKPKQPITVVGRASRIIIHHTAGHHPEIRSPTDESLEEAIRYARAIQNQHMAPGGLGSPQGGIDSGHNFLVCRNGMILQGRWLTVSAIEAGHMVRSAHCPGQNEQIGIEHEHLGIEDMTTEQFSASAALIAWISKCYGLPHPLELEPHRRYFATACPANLVAAIPSLRAEAQRWISNV